MIPNPKIKDWKIKRVKMNIIANFKKGLEE